MPSPQSLTASIAARARELGFERVGFSPASRARRAELFKAWLDRGLHGEMGYLAREPEARADPTRRDSWARSVVSLSMNYLPAGPGWGEAPGILGRLARYAAGEDYHDLLRERCESLMGFVQNLAPGTRGRIAVDTSAILERDFAEASGAGWSAKNTMIIDTEVGSWTFLGELVLDLELEYDSEPEDRCGSCRICLDACPTGAILEERMLDATRCISYLTIELRAAIPPDKRHAVGDHLFGCDICQEVCPWNRKALETREAAFRPRPIYDRVGLAEVARLSEERFRSVFGRSAIRRAKRRGLVRNALIAGANTGDGEVIKAAVDALSALDPIIRGAAAWALGQEGERRHRDALESALTRETDPSVRLEIRSALDEAAVGQSTETRRKPEERRP